MARRRKIVQEDYERRTRYVPASTSTGASLAGGAAGQTLVKQSSLDHDYGWGSFESFPIGSVFISAVSTDPATLLGYGTWSSLGAGRVLVGVDVTDPDFDTVLETGGTKIITFPDPTAEIEAAAEGAEDLATMIAGQ